MSENDEWLTMDTAPKDKTRVDLKMRDGDTKEACYWQGRAWVQRVPADEDFSEGLNIFSDASVIGWRHREAE